MQDLSEAVLVLLASRDVKEHCFLHPRHSRMLLELIWVVEALVAHRVSNFDTLHQVARLRASEPHVGFFILRLFDAGELLHDDSFRPLAVAGSIASKPQLCIFHI